MSVQNPDYVRDYAKIRERAERVVALRQANLDRYIRDTFKWHYLEDHSDYRESAKEYNESPPSWMKPEAVAVWRRIHFLVSRLYESMRIVDSWYRRVVVAEGRYPTPLPVVEKRAPSTLPEYVALSMRFSFRTARDLTISRNQFHKVYGLERGRYELECLPIVRKRAESAKRLRHLIQIIRDNNMSAGAVRAFLLGDK